MDGQEININLLNILNYENLEVGKTRSIIKGYTSWNKVKKKNSEESRHSTWARKTEQIAIKWILVV